METPDDLHKKILDYVDANLAPGEASDELTDAAWKQPGDMANPFASAMDAAATKAVKPDMAGTPPPTPKAVDTTRKLGYAAPAMHDTELEAAQKDAKDRRSTASLGQAVTDYAERPDVLNSYLMRLGGGGGAPEMKKSSVWKDYAAEGDQAVNDLMTKRKSEAGMSAKAEADAAAAENKDPASAKAQLMRSTLAKYAPSLAASLEGKSFEEMSPLAGAPLVKMIEEQSAQEKAAAKPDKNADLPSLKANLKMAYPKMASQIDGLDSVKAAEDFRLIHEGRLGREQSFANATVTADAAKEEARAIRDAAKHDKETDTSSEQAIPGLIHDPKVKLDKAEVQNIRSARADAEVMKEKIDQLDSLIQKNGLQMLPGKDKVEMQSLLKQLQLKAKGPAFAQLGVLSGPDMSILEELTGDPTDWKSLYQGGADGVRTRLKVFRDTLQSGMNNTEKTHGYAKDPASQQAPSGPMTKVGKDGATYEKRPDGLWYKVGQ